MIKLYFLIIVLYDFKNLIIPLPLTSLETIVNLILSFPILFKLFVTHELNVLSFKPEFIELNKKLTEKFFLNLLVKFS